MGRCAGVYKANDMQANVRRRFFLIGFWMIKEVQRYEFSLFSFTVVIRIMPECRDVAISSMSGAFYVIKPIFIVFFVMLKSTLFP